MVWIMIHSGSRNLGLPGVEFEPMINIAHNYAAWENHFGSDGADAGCCYQGAVIIATLAEIS